MDPGGGGREPGVLAVCDPREELAPDEDDELEDEELEDDELDEELCEELEEEEPDDFDELEVDEGDEGAGMDDGMLGDCGCGIDGMLEELDCIPAQPERTSVAPTSRPGITGRVFMTYPLERSPAPRPPTGHGCWRGMAVRCFRALAVSVALAREPIPRET